MCFAFTAHGNSGQSCFKDSWAHVYAWSGFSTRECKPGAMLSMTHTEQILLN